MSWELLQTHWPAALKWGMGIAGTLLVKYKKPIEAFLLRLAGKLLGRFWPFAESGRQLTQAEVKEILGAGLENVETLLYLLLKEYQADRVSITVYELQETGGALATCEVEVRTADMQSVRNLEKTPIPAALRAEIWAINSLPGRMLYVPDARASESAAVRAALPASGAWSAYYQSMPTSQDTERRLLAMSWQAEHLLTPQQLAQLHLSGIACAAVLQIMSRVKATPPK